VSGHAKKVLGVLGRPPREPGGTTATTAACNPSPTSRHRSWHARFFLEKRDNNGGGGNRTESVPLPRGDEAEDAAGAVA
jgi:hypothetical protein